MNWRGKAIGGSIGSFLGPWGTLAGAAAGHFFVDRKKPSPEKQSLRLLALTAGALYELAGVDGRYTVKEDKAIRAILGEINHNVGAPLAPHELAYLIDDAARIDRCLARLASTVRGNPDLVSAALGWLWRVAVSDCDEKPSETERIYAFAHQAGLSEEAVRHASLLYSRQAAAPNRERHAACSVLGVPFHADPSQIKAAYRSLSLTYHPDKHAELDPAIQALTAEKFAQVKSAYDLLSGEPGRDWYVKQPDSGRLTPAAADAVVLCFCCGTSIGLPPLEHIPSARCPVCQTLLAFERDVAEHLASFLNGPPR